MVAFFHYSPVDILSVRLPPLVLDFSCQIQEDLAKEEAAAVCYQTFQSYFCALLLEICWLEFYLLICVSFFRFQLKLNSCIWRSAMCSKHLSRGLQALNVNL